MANTYLDLQCRIAAEILRTDQTANIQNAIQRAIEFYAPRRFWFNEQRATTATTAGNAYVLYPTGLRVLDALFVTVSGVGYPLIEQSLATIEDYAQAVSTQTQPTEYCIVNGQMRLYPTPNLIYPLTVIGVFDEPALVNPTDANNWTGPAQDLIAARAKWKLGAILRNTNLMQFGKAEEAEAYQRLCAETTRRTATGRIDPSD